MRLPDIDYNAGNVRPLAKEDATQPLRSAQTEINLSRKVLQSNLKEASEKGQALRGLERSKLQTDIRSINDLATIDTSQHNFDVKQDAAKSIALVKVASGLVQTGLGVFAKYQADKIQQQQTSAKLNFARGMAEFGTQTANTATFSAPDLPKEVYTGPTTTQLPNGSSQPIQVPRHEVFPELYRHTALQNLEQQAATISDSTRREDFLNWGKVQIEESYLSQIQDSVAIQSREIVLQQTAQVNALIDEGQYSLAGQYLKETKLPESKKIAYRSKIGIKQEEAVYTKLLGSDDVVGLAETGDLLKSEGYKGKLSAESRFGWAQKFQVKIEKVSQTSKDLRIALKAEATDIAQSVLNDMVQGKNLDLSNIKNTIAYAEKNDVSPAVVHNLKKESKSLYINQAFHAADGASRAAIIRNLDTSAKTPEGRMLAQRYARENDRITKVLREDPLQYVHDQDLYQLKPFRPTSPEFWRTRKIQSRATSDRFKINAPLLTSREAQMVADNFESSAPAQKVELIQGLQKQLGDDAERVFDQVGVKNPAVRVFSFVGAKTATEAMHGASIRKEYPAAMPKRGDLQHELTKKFGNVFVTNPKMREALEQFSMDLYANKTSKLGDLSGEYDRSVMRDVLGEIPLIQYQDQVFMAPAGVDTKAFKDWLKYSEPRAMIAGGVPFMKDEDVVRNIRNENFTLLQVSRDQWYLLDSETGRVVSTDGQQPFILKYDADLPYKGTFSFPYDPKQKKTVGDIIRDDWDKNLMMAP